MLLALALALDVAYSKYHVNVYVKQMDILGAVSQLYANPAIYVN